MQRTEQGVLISNQELDSLLQHIQASYEAHGDVKMLSCIEILMRETNELIKAQEWLNHLIK